MTNQICRTLGGLGRRAQRGFVPRATPSAWVVSALAVLLLAAGAGLPGGRPLRAQPGSGTPPSSANATQGAKKTTPSAIQIEPVQIGEVGLPPEFRVAVYENTVQQVTRLGKFQHVYRSGDRAASDAPDLVTLRMTVKGFKHGSERERAVTTVMGATSVDLGVQVTNRDGQVLLDRDVEGTVRFLGGNLRATYDFSKNVAKLLQKNF